MAVVDPPKPRKLVINSQRCDVVHSSYKQEIKIDYKVFKKSHTIAYLDLRH